MKYNITTAIEVMPYIAGGGVTGEYFVTYRGKRNWFERLFKIKTKPDVVVLYGWGDKMSRARYFDITDGHPIKHHEHFMLTLRDYCENLREANYIKKIQERIEQLLKKGKVELQ